MKITISETARISLDEIIGFLQAKWLQKKLLFYKLILGNLGKQ